MMTLQKQSDETLATLLQQLREERMDGGDPITKLRGAAWMEFQGRGLPTKQDEAFRYVTLRKLYANNYTSPVATSLNQEAITPWVLPECTNSVLVFVNGWYSPELSQRSAIPANVVIDTLSKAFRTYSSFISNAWQRSLSNEKDPFALLNAALHSDAAFIYVPPKVVVEAPIQILSIVDAADQSALILPRWHLFAGSSSQVKLITSEKILSGAACASVLAYDLTIEENAHVSVHQVVNSERTDNWRLEAGRAVLKRNATLDAVALMEGGEASRIDWHVALAGEGSQANLNGLGLYNEKHEGHVHVLVEHQAPHCQSNQLYKNVLRGSSRSSFEGKIYVHQAAQKTDAFQLNNNLLLSDSALCYSKPNLEIFADDVKATHGSTTGQLDDEQLFYLMARGLDRTSAQNVLIQGFCSEVIDKITVSSLLREVDSAASAYIASK